MGKQGFEMAAQVRTADEIPSSLAKTIILTKKGGRNIEWMRRVYNIGPKKLFLFNLFCLLALYYFPFTKFI